MKQTSKDKLILESISDKLEIARKLKRQEQYYQAIEAYHKVIFLKQDSTYLFQIAEIYEQLLDHSSALLFYRRSYQLNSSSSAQQKIRDLTKIQGLQLLSIGSVKNILEDTDFIIFKKRYSTFHKKLLKKVEQKSLISDFLESCLAYLEVNQLQLAFNEIENCIMINDRDVDIIVMRALLNWSMMQNEQGYKDFWLGYSIDKTNLQIQMFIQMITPQLQVLYKEAKYDLIDKKPQKCKLKVKKALQMHPYHTQFLVLSAYLHRVKQEYEQALSDLQLANKHLQNRQLEEQLKNQISLTYNQMGIYLYKQGKFNEAITLFTQGLTFKSKDWGIYTNRGDCYKSLNQYIKALEDYLKAYDIEKKNQDLNFRISTIYNIRGISLFNSKNYDFALKQFEESLKFSPKCAQFYLSKAKCLIQLNRKNQAIDSLQKCIMLDEKIIEANQLLLQFKDTEDKRNKVNKKVIYLSKEK